MTHLSFQLQLVKELPKPWGESKHECTIFALHNAIYVRATATGVFTGKVDML
jgi:hypothetical protein